MMVLTIKACVLLAGAPYIVADARTQQQPLASQQTQTVKATVQKVDKDTREVTLKREDGSVVTIKAPDTVRNFDQIKPGDTVTARYTESVALNIRRSDEPPTASERQTLKRAPVGSKPSGEQTLTQQVSATVEKINRNTREVTLMAPDGTTTVVKVPEEMKRFDTLKQGDQVVVTATQSLAIDVSEEK
jgi:Cu/Ag efflux protein CusF